MGEKKVTTMVLKVDLQCSKCYLKVKKVLCKFPQIQEQKYDEKQNKVTIKVVCCSPEKIRDKICCKGDGIIESIEILPEKPPPPPKVEQPPPPPKVEQPPPKVEPPPPKVEPPPPPPPPKVEPCNPQALNPVRECCRECYEGHGGGPCYQVRVRVRVPEPCNPPFPNPLRECCRECSEGRGGGPCYKLPVWDPEPRNPVRVCCRECSEGRGGGPCYELPVRVPEPCNPPVPNPVRVCCRECSEGHGGGPCYRLGYGQVRYDDGCNGRPVYDSWGSGIGYESVYYKSRCTEYISEENPTACGIM